MNRTTRTMKFAAVATAVALTGVLTACGSSSTTAGGKSVTTLKLANDKPQFTGGYQALGKLSAKQVGVGLSVNPYSTTAAEQTVVEQAKAAGTHPPALFTWQVGSELQQLVNAHVVASTSSIWKQAIANGTLPASLEKYYTYNGQQYCVPETLDYWGMFYSKSLFAKYHLSVPTTWSQLMNIAATLKSHGTTPFYEVDNVFAFVWFELLLGQSNPTAYNQLVTGKISFTSPPVVKAMTMWKSLIAKGYMSDPTTKTLPVDLLAAGNVAMIPAGTWEASEFLTIHYPTSKYGFFLIPNVNPSLSKKITFLETSPLCAGANSPTTHAATRELKWWVTTQAQSLWAKTEQDISANPQVKAPVPDFAKVNNAVKSGQLQALERYYEAVPASVLQESLNDFAAFMVNPGSYKTQLNNIQKVDAKAFPGSGS